MGVSLMLITDDAFPTRAPVWWGHRGPPGPHPERPGVTGRQVVIRIPKSLSGLEAVISRILRAPKEVRRPMDDMNSVLWELMDGTNQFKEICRLMDATFHERIVPADERLRASVNLLVSDGLAIVRATPFKGEWNLSPRYDPSGKLLPPSSSLGLDSEE
jgi:hypothetical protein